MRFQLLEVNPQDPGSGRSILEKAWLQGGFSASTGERCLKGILTMENAFNNTNESCSRLNKTRTHYRILLAAIALCLFMYIDAYWVPTKATEEVTLTIRDLESRSKTATSHTYLLKTNAREYDITESLYSGISIGDTVIMQRSGLTGSPQKASLIRGEYLYTYEIGFIRARLGLVLLPLIGFGICIFMLFYKKLDNLQGRSNMTYFLFTASLILFLFHLDLHIF